jgi:hypothetical protein
MNKNIVEALKNGMAGGILGAVVSALLNYFIVPFPKSVVDNVLGHSIGGFFLRFFCRANRGFGVYTSP